MSLRDVVREFKELPIGLLDRPVIDARMDRDEAQLDELAGDIAKRGVILPLAVVRTGERYEIVDGFCRYIASTRAGLVTVPCLVYPDKSTALEGVKYAANLFRQDMSPAEEATFFHELFEHECGQDIDAVCALVNKKRSYVDARLQLVLGDEQVFEAVRERKITLGVAEKLNEIPAEDYRRHYLYHAIRGGATVSMVTGWVMEWKNLYGERGPQATAPPVEQIAAAVSPVYDPMRCEVCRKSNEFIPQQIHVHQHCKLAVLDPMLAAYRGESVDNG